MTSFNGEELLAPRPTPKLEDHPLSAVCDCWFNIFATAFLTEGRYSVHNQRTWRAVVTRTHVSCISDPATYKNWITVKISNMYKIQEFCNCKYFYISYLRILTILCYIASLLLYCLILISVVIIQKWT
jgi:hypothetical protein